MVHRFYCGGSGWSHHWSTVEVQGGVYLTCLPEWWWGIGVNLHISFYPRTSETQRLAVQVPKVAGQHGKPQRQCPLKVKN